MLSSSQADHASVTKGFFFKRRHGKKLDWRKLAAVDLDKIVSQVDVDSLQDNLEHITFADVGEDDVRYFTDTNFVKLFRLCQLTIEYLLNTQAYLLSKHQEKEQQCAQLLVDVQNQRQALQKKETELLELQKELGYAKKVVKAYDKAVDTVAKRKRQAEDRISDSSQVHVDVAYKCTQCNSSFVSDEYLQSHYKRRHPDYFKSISLSVPPELLDKRQQGSEAMLSTQDWLKRWGEGVQEEIARRVVQAVTMHSEQTMINRFRSLEEQLKQMLQSQLLSIVTQQEEALQRWQQRRLRTGELMDAADGPISPRRIAANEQQSRLDAKYTQELQQMMLQTQMQVQLILQGQESNHRTIQDFISREVNSLRYDLNTARSAAGVALGGAASAFAPAAISPRGGTGSAFAPRQTSPRNGFASEPAQPLVPYGQDAFRAQSPFPASPQPDARTGIFASARSTSPYGTQNKGAAGRYDSFQPVPSGPHAPSSGYGGREPSSPTPPSPRTQRAQQPQLSPRSSAQPPSVVVTGPQHRPASPRQTAGDRGRDPEGARLRDVLIRRQPTHPIAEMPFLKARYQHPQKLLEETAAKFEHVLSQPPRAGFYEQMQRDIEQSRADPRAVERRVDDITRMYYERPTEQQLRLAVGQIAHVKVPTSPQSAPARAGPMSARSSGSPVPVREQQQLRQPPRQYAASERWGEQDGAMTARSTTPTMSPQQRGRSLQQQQAPDSPLFPAPSGRPPLRADAASSRNSQFAQRRDEVDEFDYDAPARVAQISPRNTGESGQDMKPGAFGPNMTPRSVFERPGAAPLHPASPALTGSLSPRRDSNTSVPADHRRAPSGGQTSGAFLQPPPPQRAPTSEQHLFAPPAGNTSPRRNSDSLTISGFASRGVQQGSEVQRRPSPSLDVPERGGFQTQQGRLSPTAKREPMRTEASFTARSEDRGFNSPSLQADTSPSHRELELQRSHSPSVDPNRSPHPHYQPDAWNRADQDSSPRLNDNRIQESSEVQPFDNDEPYSPSPVRQTMTRAPEPQRLSPRSLQVPTQGRLGASSNPQANRSGFGYDQRVGNQGAADYNTDRVRQSNTYSFQGQQEKPLQQQSRGGRDDKSGSLRVPGHPQQQQQQQRSVFSNDFFVEDDDLEAEMLT